MSIWNGDVYGTVWGVEENDGRVNIEFSTSKKQMWAKAIEKEKKFNPKADIRKDADGKEFYYENSSWGKYVRLAGEASGLGTRLSEMLKESRPVRIKVPQGKMNMDNSPYYTESGEKKYPKQPALTILDFEFMDDVAQSRQAPPPDEDIPF